MSLRTDGKYRCDRCDADVINGSIHYAVVVVDLHPFRPGEMRQLHWCRENGCSVAVLSPVNLSMWLVAEGVLP